MQKEAIFYEKLFSILCSAESNIAIAEGIFKTLTALNEWPNESCDDEEKSKNFANTSLAFIFDFAEEYDDQIKELETLGSHPALASLKELKDVSDALLCLLLCIGKLGIQGTGGISKTGDYIISKSKNNIESRMADLRAKMRIYSVAA